MFRKPTLLACTIMCCGFVAASATAQEVSTPAVEIGLNYSWLHVNSSNYDYHRTGNGGSGYVEYNLNSSFGLVADIGGYANTRTGIGDTAMTYLFGPRFNFRRSRFTPYVQALFGGVSAWTPTPGTQNAFAMAAGGGLDFRVSNYIAVKPIQAEYVMTRLPNALGFGSHQNDIRYSAGVVFRIGSK